MANTYFPARPEAKPMIYAYRDSSPQYEGLLKVGYTTKDVRERVAEQYPVIRPGERPYTIVLEETAIRDDGTTFLDKRVHAVLRRRGFDNPAGEWFRCSKKEVLAAVNAVRHHEENATQRTANFKMRPEQERAVTLTADYFRRFAKEEEGKVPRFLWNAKMRFGKTFAAYELALRMGWKRLLVLTFKPAVQDAWETDLSEHVDFEGWQFISRGGLTYKDADPGKPFVCFASFQDFLGRNDVGGIKLRNEWAHLINWDCIILDEYHYGAWRERAKDLFEGEEKRERAYDEGPGLDYYDEDILPLTTNGYLYLSGTPFRAIASGEFIEEQIFNWTYSDEQAAKEAWTGQDNPYAALPRMVMMTYQMPDTITDVAKQGEFNEFDLNEFFRAEGQREEACFIYADEVQKWLDLIRGAFQETTVDNLKMGAQKPPFPFSDRRLLNVLNHTFWFLPNVASCYAMRNLLAERQNVFYHDYKVVVCAGAEAGIGLDALLPVKKAMGNPLETKTITLSCGKLTTGVTVKPWAGILMLRNTTSPETYFQAAFRVQSPWTIDNPDGLSPNRQEIMKQECYVFDFAPNRALRQIQEYSCELNPEETNPEKKVDDIIHFLPILCYDGFGMREINAQEVLDFAMSGTSATLLARRWESASLVNVNNATLKRLMDNADAMEALSNIEGFRSLNQDITTIINKSEAVKKVKKEANERELDSKEKKELTDDEKKMKSLRKQIQEKLIKFAARIPVFMYLTDYREHCLRDVITQLEPGLFQKVTGLRIKDFELLVSLGIFNGPVMDNAVFCFKRYEDASLSYAGIDRHEADRKVGGFGTVLSKEEFSGMFVNQGAS